MPAYPDLFIAICPFPCEAAARNAAKAAYNSGLFKLYHKFS